MLINYFKISSELLKMLFFLDGTILVGWLATPIPNLRIPNKKNDCLKKILYCTTILFFLPICKHVFLFGLVFKEMFDTLSEINRC
jgi:hypothetical protein